MFGLLFTGRGRALELTLRSTFLGTLRVEVAETHFLTDTPAGWRRIDVVGAGSFEGPLIKATIVSGGSDALLRRQDGAMQPDVRLTIKTDDNAYLYLTYRGIRHGPAAVMTRIAQGEPVEPQEYYLRNAIFFETGAPKYDWLNRIIAVGIGRRTPNAAIYEVHEIL
jgi:hypothetical protein